MTNWKTGEHAKYASALREAERRHGIPRDLLARLCNFDREAIAGERRNWLGCLGIASITPDVAAIFGERVPGKDARLEPGHAIEMAARYLRWLHRCFGSWRLAALAYRWHHDFVRKLLRREPGEIAPCIPPMIATDVAQIAADVGL